MSIPNTSRFTRQHATSTPLSSTPALTQRTLAKMPVTKEPATRTSKENKATGDLQVVIPKDLRRPLTESERKPLTAIRTHPTQPHGGQGPSPRQRRTQRPVVVSDFEVPEVMVDEERNRTYNKICYLGEGGFARCYKVKSSTNRMYAAKVISKSTLRERRNKIKLFAEINIHRSMNYKGIVRFHSCFEDAHNVYLIVELCDNKTLAEMIKRRSRLTEPEIRYFLIQILDACRYMHDNHVIHRDIKLSNVFLDKNMDVKIGDFGLSALLVNSKDRKMTVCGTPNYIAPEILFSKSGHDHKVDLWSIGVLMFTLLVGKHPFYQKDVKAIYRKIHQNSNEPAYEFPLTMDISDDAKDLIRRLLVNRPDMRPSVPEILNHSFFQNGTLPPRIPRIARQRQPTDDELFQSPLPPPPIMASPGRAGDVLREAINEHKSYVDRRPIGPIKIMSENIPAPRAQFPLPANTNPNTATASSSSPSEGRACDIPPPSKVTTTAEDSQQPSCEKKEQHPSLTRDEDQRDRSPPHHSRKRVPPADDQPRKRRDPALPTEPESVHTRLKAPMFKHDSEQQQQQPIREKAVRYAQGVSILETMLRVLREVLMESRSGKGSTGRPIEEFTWSPVHVFLDKWVDFSSKYGLGYSLTDGTRGAYFNDATSMTTKDDNMYYYVIHQEPGTRQMHRADSMPSELRKKVFIMRNFKEYMETKLARMAVNMPETITGSGNFYLTKYIAAEKALVFRLSNNVVQFNFYNHSKLILTEYGTKVIYISASRRLDVYRIEDAVVSQNKELVDMLNYARNMLEDQIASRHRMSNNNH